MVVPLIRLVYRLVTPDRQSPILALAAENFQQHLGHGYMFLILIGLMID